MATSGSKYSAMTEAMKEKIGILSVGINDKIRQKQIEAEIKRIDTDVERESEEVSNTPVDSELVMKQAEADYETALSSHKRQADAMVAKVTDTIAQLDHRKELAERELQDTKEHANQQQTQADLKAKQALERTKSSVGNKEKTIELRVQQVVMNGEKRKADLEAEKDNIIAKTEAHSEKIECVEQLYSDLKEISLKLGDVGK